jgi:hypothetical protein
MSCVYLIRNQGRLFVSTEAHNQRGRQGQPSRDHTPFGHLIGANETVFAHHELHSLVTKSGLPFFLGRIMQPEGKAGAVKDGIVRFFQHLTGAEWRLRLNFMIRFTRYENMVALSPLPEFLKVGISRLEGKAGTR